MKHKQELINIIMADAKLQYQYANSEGETCAVGGIAVAFGWDAKPLKGDTNGKGIDALFDIRSNARMMPFLKNAMKHFDLTKPQVKRLQTVNDLHRNDATRHLRLKELIESWEETE